MFCKQCGKKVESSYKFCPYCGEPTITGEDCYDQPAPFVIDPEDTPTYTQEPPFSDFEEYPPENLPEFPCADDDLPDAFEDAPDIAPPYYVFHPDTPAPYIPTQTDIPPDCDFEEPDEEPPESETDDLYFSLPNLNFDSLDEQADLQMMPPAKPTAQTNPQDLGLAIKLLVIVLTLTFAIGISVFGYRFLHGSTPFFNTDQAALFAMAFHA